MGAGRPDASAAQRRKSDGFSLSIEPGAKIPIMLAALLT
jgi:hypothetical protein